MSARSRDNAGEDYAIEQIANAGMNYAMEQVAKNAKVQKSTVERKSTAQLITQLMKAKKS